MELEPVELVCQIVESLGYKAKAESSLDGISGRVWIEKVLNEEFAEKRFAPYMTIMEIHVSGAILTCKSDRIPIAYDTGHIVDLHDPNSLDQLKRLTKYYETITKQHTDETLVKLFMMERMQRRALGDDQE